METELIDWNTLTLFFYIFARMFGFVAFSPFFARNGVPVLLRTGLVLVFSLTAQLSYTGTVPIPSTIEETAFRLFAEMGVGLALNLVIRFFLFIPEQAGELVDTQMGMAMARNYDPGAQSNSTINASLLSQLMLILFFMGNGHVTLIRLMLTSGNLVPYGSAALGPTTADLGLTLFTECMLLSIKMGFPLLAAELLGQMGMGILMKVIPQINVFAMNIELKVIIGLLMLSMLMEPIGNYMLEAEVYMLTQIRELIAVSGG